jgi:CubicO group peptidase (beta-lactamase class C family)
MESGFNARPIDYARFGYLFAHDGRVGDRQVVPEEWVAEATAADTSTDPAEHYQYWWWVDTDHPGRFSARGNKGQFVYVDPATDVVVVRTGVDFGIDDWPEVLADVVDRVNAAAELSIVSSLFPVSGERIEVRAVLVDHELRVREGRGAR